VNRRQFMAAAAALNTAVMAGPRAFAARARARDARAIERVITDVRFAPSAAFGAAVAKTGARVSAIDGDITRIWFDDIADHFAAGSGPVAGLTTARTALVLVELARGPGVRVLWRAEHGVLPDGRIRHDLEGPVALVERAAEVAGTADWNLRLARLLAATKHAKGEHARLRVRGVTGDASAPKLEETLSSWVLVPRRTALG
jgi:hypothetical protein